MQADINVMQPTQPGRCPLCHSPLTTHSSSPSQRTMLMCSACGFSAPFVARQTSHASAATQRRSSISGSSVWIDPAVSPYFGNKQMVDAPIYPPTPSTPASPGGHGPQKTQPNPVTPIPSRASAHQPAHIKVRPKYSRSTIQSMQAEQNVSSVPVLPPPTMWQYETPDFEVESSLPALSLVVDVPTAPETPTPTLPKATRRLAHIDEIDTVPPKHAGLVRLPVMLELQVVQEGAPPSCRSARCPRNLSPLLVAVGGKRGNTGKRTSPAKHVTDIDEIDTMPARNVPGQRVTNIDDVDTLPPFTISKKMPASQAPTQAVAIVPPATSAMDRLAQLEHNRWLRTARQLEKVNDPSSWTAGGAADSVYARRIAERTKEHYFQQPVSFHILDHLRWWLLQPNRIEFILWLGGTLLLMCVTFGLLLATAISFSWVTPNFQFQPSIISPFQPNANSTGSTGSGNNPGSRPTVVTTHGLTLLLFDSGPLVAGQPIHLQGKGLTPHGNVFFTNEKSQPVIDMHSQSNIIQADDQGMFNALLDDTGWAAGQHIIFVQDVVSGRSAEMSIVLAAGLFGKKGTTTPVPSTSPYPGVTATATVNSGGGFPTPVNQTPVPVGSSPTPAPRPSATPTQTEPTPTATAGVTPTTTPATTPTVGVTPTATSSPSAGGGAGSANMTPTPVATSSPATSNSGTQFMAASVENSAPRTSLDSWMWLIILGYSLALALLGLAGVLNKRAR